MAHDESAQNQLVDKMFGSLRLGDAAAQPSSFEPAYRMQQPPIAQQRQRNIKQLTVLVSLSQPAHTQDHLMRLPPELRDTIYRDIPFTFDVNGTNAFIPGFWKISEESLSNLTTCDITIRSHDIRDAELQWSQEPRYYEADPLVRLRTVLSRVKDMVEQMTNIYSISLHFVDCAITTEYLKAAFNPNPVTEFPRNNLRVHMTQFLLALFDVVHVTVSMRRCVKCVSRDHPDDEPAVVCRWGKNRWEVWEGYRQEIIPAACFESHEAADSPERIWDHGAEWLAYSRALQADYMKQRILGAEQVP